MRSIKNIHKAEARPISDLLTFSPMPSSSLQMLDPFIFLNHHGYQEYGKNNKGLPFGPHPHRGMETVTFILEGDVAHKDTGGHESVINKGGVQWMTAGRGLMHAEVSSKQFKEQGGPLEILQLWVNLPARLKHTEPAYTGLQKEEIPTNLSDDGKVRTQVVSGILNGTSGGIQTLTPIHLATLFFESGGCFKTSIPQDHNILCYVIRGEVKIQGETIDRRKLVEFNNDSPELQIDALTDSILLFGHAKPFNEPVVTGGPFVMNTQEEINQAYIDFQAGKFGSWTQ